MLAENLEGIKDGHSDVDSHLHVNGFGLSTPASPRTPDNVATARSTARTSIEE
jgi:hypothetical protein